MKVKNMMSPKGTVVANQFILYTDEGRYFQSYDSVIAFIPKEGKTQLDEKCWNCSRTTGKYRQIFLGETLNETRRKIEQGIYELTNLN